MTQMFDNAVCQVDAFKLAAQFAKSARIDLSRGDPLDPPSARAQAVHTVLSYFVQRTLEAAARHGPVRDLPPELLVSLWWQTLRMPWVSRRVRSDAVAVLEAVSRAIRRDSESGPAAALVETLRRLATELPGSRYGDPCGHAHLRQAAAEFIQQLIAPPAQGVVSVMNCDNVVLTNGASEAIGSTWRLLASRHMAPGDVVGTIAPVYSPYLEIAKGVGATIATVPTCAQNGWEPTDNDLAAFDGDIRRLGRPLKAFILVNPGNPSGVAFRQSTVAALASMLCKYDECVVMEDMVYAPFLPRGTYQSLWAHLPDRSILIHSLSKIERVTGGRLGFLLVTESANTKLGTLLGEGASAGRTVAVGNGDFRTLLSLAKGPGPQGELNHTQMQASPSQWDAIIHLVLNDGGGAFVDSLRERWLTFYHELGLPVPGQYSGRTRDTNYVPYYCLIDTSCLIQSMAAQDSLYEALAEAIEHGGLSSWQVFSQFARVGVAVMPAARFFPEPAKNQWLFRVSVANETLERVREAARLIRAALEDLAVQWRLARAA